MLLLQDFKKWGGRSAQGVCPGLVYGALTGLEENGKEEERPARHQRYIIQEDGRQGVLYLIRATCALPENRMG